MKVWLVEHLIEYENAYIVGIASTEEIGKRMYENFIRATDLTAFQGSMSVAEIKVDKDSYYKVDLMK